MGLILDILILLFRLILEDREAGSAIAIATASIDTSYGRAFMNNADEESFIGNINERMQILEEEPNTVLLTWTGFMIPRKEYASCLVTLSEKYK